VGGGELTCGESIPPLALDIREADLFVQKCREANSAMAIYARRARSSSVKTRRRERRRQNERGMRN
jgi:hypothetical protein